MTTRPTLDSGAATKAALFAAVLGALWFGLAWSANPTTFHFGALIVAATIPYGYVTIAGSAPTGQQVLAMSAGGVGGALLLTAVLSAAEKLQGPSLLPFGGAAMEAVIFSFMGGGISLLASLRPAPLKR